MRYFLRFSYHGKAYHGWQRQPNALTVQEVLEDALSTILRTTIEVTGAGRTDAGVHAKELVAHFDYTEIKDHADFVRRVNSYLPDDIAVRELLKTTDGAHARFDAVERTYEYWITQEKNPFLVDFGHQVSLPLDIGAMNKAAGILLDYKDFECFSRSNTDVKTFNCTIKIASWEQKNDLLVFTITADRFLRNMVRAIVGTLLNVGLGKISVEEMHTIIKSKDRGKAGASAPAKGLYLTRVVYPDTIFE